MSAYRIVAVLAVLLASAVRAQSQQPLADPPTPSRNDVPKMTTQEKKGYAKDMAKRRELSPYDPKVDYWSMGDFPGRNGYWPATRPKASSSPPEKRP